MDQKWKVWYLHGLDIPLIRGAFQIDRIYLKKNRFEISFHCSFDNPETDTWEALAQILHKAFIRAIQPVIDTEINIQTVDHAGAEKKTFLQKLFDKNEKDDQ